MEFAKRNKPLYHRHFGRFGKDTELCGKHPNKTGGQEVGGSNPLSPTSANRHRILRWVFVSVKRRLTHRDAFFVERGRRILNFVLQSAVLREITPRNAGYLCLAGVSLPFLTRDLSVVSHPCFDIPQMINKRSVNQNRSLPMVMMPLSELIVRKRIWIIMLERIEANSR